MMYYLNKGTGYATGYAVRMYRIFGDETEKTKEIVLNKKSLKMEAWLYEKQAESIEFRNDR